MTRHMWDAVDVNGIPADIPPTDLVAGYVNGRYANMGALIARFPNHLHVSIAVTADATALVLDVETYDATPDQAPGWARRMRQAGLIPTVYCNSSTWPAVRAAFHNQASPEPNWWIAQYDNVPCLFPDTVAKQYQNTAHYDLSIVADHWPGIDPEDTMPYTQAQLTQFAQDGATAALQSLAGRNAIALAELWWLDYALTGTTTAGMSSAQAALVLDIHRAITALGQHGPGPAAGAATDTPTSTPTAGA